MYFIPRNNRFYSWSIHTKPGIRYLASLFLIGCVAMFWWYTHTWLQKAIDLSKQEITALEKQCIQNDHALHACQQLRKSMPQLQEKLQSYATANLEELLQVHMMFIIEQAERAGLSVQDYFADKDINKDWYVHGAGRYHFQGTFDQTTNFFTMLTVADKMIKCNQVQLTRISDTLFDVTCQLYFMVVKKV